MSVLRTAPAATPDVGDDLDRTPKGDRACCVASTSCTGWSVAGARRKESCEPSPTTVVVTERMFSRVATLSSTRTVGRIAVAIGTGIAAVAIH